MNEAGWRLWPFHDGIATWAHAAHEIALTELQRPENAHWYRCNRTWFAGVDCLSNDATGRLPGGEVPSGPAWETLPDLPLHPAQLSAVFPGYPQPMEGESPAASNFRMTRDAAHIDGLLPEGTDRRRHLREPHAYVLGVPLTASHPLASPLVVFEGSHRIMAEAFRNAFRGISAKDWPSVDVTKIYQDARRRCFRQCRRMTVPAKPGEAIVLHRLLLHGIAPWTAPPEGPRITAYFRPIGAIEDWLHL